MRACALAALLALLLAAGAQPARAQPAPSQPSQQPAPQHGPPLHAPAAGPYGYATPPRWSDPFGWELPQVEGFDVLYVDDAPLLLSHYVPAGGPLQRHTGRPGAWYTAVFLPMAPRWPVQVWLSQRVRTHELRVTALDASPVGTAGVAVAVPLTVARSAGRISLASAPMALPASSQADGVFLLIELWSLAGDRPGPIWVQARSRIFRDTERRPWWDSRTEPDGLPPSGALAPHPPASPLNTPRGFGGVIELPIMRRVHTP